MRSDYYITLDLQSSQAAKAVQLHQHDNGCRLYFTLTQGGREYALSQDCQGVFTAKKRDGTAIFNDCVLENGALFYDVTPQTTAEAGELNCQLRLYGKDGALLHSAAFLLVVHPAAVSDNDDIASMPEATALQRILEGVQNLPKGNKTYRLIEKVTLEEAVASFKRTADPAGKPYNFSAVVMSMSCPEATASAQLILSFKGASKQVVYHQISGGLTTAGTVAFCKAYNDCGLAEYHACVSKLDVSATPTKKTNYTIRTWENVESITVTTYAPSGTVQIPAGTVVTIYAIEEDANA